MIDDQLVLRVERLRDSVQQLRDDIRVRYKKPQRQVVSEEIRNAAALLGERWLVEIGGREDVRAVLGEELVADLSIQFQRLITYSEAATIRRRYDEALRAILTNFRTRVVIPLKQKRGAATRHYSAAPIANLSDARRAFVGQSFAPADQLVNDTIRKFLESMDIQVITGQRPAARSVSEKVKARIESADIFVGIFTCRDQLAKGGEWSASAWVIDEKAYAIALDKKLVLIKEKGVHSIGGLQGDYEYLEFDRARLQDLVLALLQTFRAS
jgi:hypothetical protein